MSFLRLTLILLFFSSCFQDRQKKIVVKESKTYYMNDTNFVRSNPQKDGFVPDDTTAIKIAVAIWLPIYGKQIYESTPFLAILRNDSIWEVTGTINTTEGGAPFAFIQKSNGKILDVYHEK